MDVYLVTLTKRNRDLEGKYPVGIYSTHDLAVKAIERVLPGRVLAYDDDRFAPEGVAYLICDITRFEVDDDAEAMPWYQAICIGAVRAEHTECKEEAIISRKRAEKLETLFPVLKGKSATSR